MSTAEPSAWEEVYEIVRQIPAGKVMSYGQVAQLLVRRLSPRAVGWAMHDCPDDVPWQRVVNAKGECSSDRVAGNVAGRQRALLETEGVGFDAHGRVVMDEYRWSADDEDL